MPEPKRPCPHCSRLVGINRGLSSHYAHRPSCWVAENCLSAIARPVSPIFPIGPTMLLTPSVPQINFSRMQHGQTRTTTSMSMRPILLLIPTVMLLCPVVLAMLVQENPVPNSSRASLDWGTWILMRSRQFLDLRPWMLRLTACLSLIAQV